MSGLTVAVAEEGSTATLALLKRQCTRIQNGTIELGPGSTVQVHVHVNKTETGSTVHGTCLGTGEGRIDRYCVSQYPRSKRRWSQTLQPPTTYLYTALSLSHSQGTL
jgi:hypothetical protein